MELLKDHDAMQRGICENPLDHTARLVFADWLDDHAEALSCPTCKPKNKMSCPTCRKGENVFRTRAALIRGQFALEDLLAEYPYHTWENLDMYLDAGDSVQQQIKHQAKRMMTEHCWQVDAVKPLFAASDLRPHPDVQPDRTRLTKVRVDTLFPGAPPLKVNLRVTVGVRTKAGRRPVASYMDHVRNYAARVRRGFVEEIHHAQIEYVNTFAHVTAFYPLVAYRVTNCTPWYNNGTYSWYSDCMPREVAIDIQVRANRDVPRAIIYQDVFTRLPRAKDEVPAGNTFRACYASSEAAHEALSRACVNSMRARTGLPPIRWGDDLFSEW